jgi:formimidoylglutamate deiminase
MLDAGITTVGEFHYFHHSPGAADYAFDQLVLEAAATAGIRLVLLNTYYASGGVRQPVAGAQRRFESRNLEQYWDQMDRLDVLRDRRTQTLGAVAHSIRAVPIDDIRLLHEEATRRGFVFHMHVEEQVREIEECRKAYGRRPMQLLMETLEVGDNLTAVHCTHSHRDDLARFLAAGGMVSVCPLTEANLGDGIPALGLIHGTGGRLSLGTDSNARICFLEEMRWLEYGQRLRSQTRGRLADRLGLVARALLEIATAGGARTIGVEAGRIEAGRWADLVAIDLTHRALADCEEENLLEALVFGGDNVVIRGTCVGGRWRERSEGFRTPAVQGHVSAPV